MVPSPGDALALDAAVLTNLRELGEESGVDIVREVGVLFRTDTSPRLTVLQLATDHGDSLKERSSCRKLGVAPVRWFSQEVEKDLLRIVAVLVPHPYRSRCFNFSEEPLL